MVGFKGGLMKIFWAFKLSFVVDILAFFGLETVWATFLKNLVICFQIF
jgi:hypothetical protein